MDKINEVLDSKSTKIKCDKTCKNYAFEHREVACVLSDVYSVKKNELCGIHSQINVINI
jgi:hypothetical protein